jgi:ataxin-10
LDAILITFIDLLCLLDVFLPRINFGKPVNRDGTPAEPQTTNVGDPARGFLYLKRDLVRLLGVLCHGVKSVQDRARQAGGLPVVMNMCVIDERNPCKSTGLVFSHH